MVLKTIRVGALFNYSPKKKTPRKTRGVFFFIFLTLIHSRLPHHQQSPGSHW
jgi:hypothetical protein